MAPKRQSGKETVGASSGRGRGGNRTKPVNRKKNQGRATRTQARAQEAGHFFRNRLPSPVREEIESMEKRLWDTIQDLPADELRGEVEEWVMDPGSTAGRASAYDRMVMLYWVTKNLLAHAIMTNMAKAEGDEEPVRAWKDHNAESRLMHRKIDAIANKLGLTFYDPRREMAEQAGLGPGRASWIRHQEGIHLGSSSGDGQQAEEARREEAEKGIQQAQIETINLEET